MFLFFFNGELVFQFWKFEFVVRSVSMAWAQPQMLFDCFGQPVGHAPLTPQLPPQHPHPRWHPNLGNWKGGKQKGGFNGGKAGKGGPPHDAGGMPARNAANGAKAPGQVVGDKDKKQERKEKKKQEPSQLAAAAPSSPVTITCSNGTVWEELICREFSMVSMAEIARDPIVRVVNVRLKDSRQGGGIFQEIVAPPGNTVTVM